MNEIQVYSLNLDLDSILLDELFEILTPEERLRGGRFRSSRDRARFTACRGMLRQILSRYTDRPPARLRFVTNPFGKPALERSPLRFNVSHSAGRALVAITEGREVGVDLERIDPRFASEQIPEHFFSSREIAALRALPREQQTEAFFHCWCRKEAYIKARGFGLSLALDSFDVSLVPGQPAALLRGGAGWSLEALDAGPGFAAAVAAQGSGWSVTSSSFAPGLPAKRGCVAGTA